VMPTTQVSRRRSSAKVWTGRRAFVVEAGPALLLSLLAVWKGLIPGWRVLNTDFPNYYVVARLIRAHYCLDRIYDWIWFQRIAGKFGINQHLVGFLGLTPFSALPIVPLSGLPVLEAKRIWIVFNIGMLAAAVHLLSRQTGLSYRRAWLITLCAVIPLRTSFLFGQMHIFVLLLLVLAYVCHMRGREIGSGCCIALAAALKVYPVFFCFYFLLKRRWKALTAALAGTALCLLLTYLVNGPGAMRAYLFQQLPRSLQGESGNPFLPTLTSSSALFHRLFLYEPELNPHPLIFSPVFYAVLYPVWQAVLAGVVLYRMRGDFRPDEREALEWSMFLCLLMFLSSASASYQFVVLIAAAMPTISALLNQRRWKVAAVYFFLFVAACNIRTIQFDRPVSILTPLFYAKLWCGVALIVFYCALLKPLVGDRRADANALLRSPVFTAVAVVICLWISGAIGAWSHVRRTRAGEPVLADGSDAAYMRIGPVATDADLFYVAMLRDGYRVLSTGRALSDRYPEREPATSEVSFATTRSGKDVWVEAVSAGTSQLVHFVSGAPAAASCRIRDAETPAVSSDESILAFVRENGGHGSLWTVDLRECDESGGAVPMRVTPLSFDVRTVSAGANNTFLIAAIYQGKERVFTVSARSTPKLLADGNGALDSAAISPDGKMLVVRELVSERWQLMSLDLSSHVWKQLTYGDCNAYTPSWRDDRALLYATDCMRGVGFATLAWLRVER